MRKARRSILLTAILISLAAITYKVTDILRRVHKEVKATPIKALDYLPESALRLKEFHRAKIEDGRKVWELFGDEASYFKEQKEALIKKPRFYYYDKKAKLLRRRVMRLCSISTKRNWSEWNCMAMFRLLFRDTY